MTDWTYWVNTTSFHERESERIAAAVRMRAVAMMNDRRCATMSVKTT
jgi:hypothetical protein